MGVPARIKILECKSFEEVERKVNDFLAFDKDIEHVARINYQLEYNVVIVEYVVFGSEEEERREKNEIIMRAVAEEEYNVAVANNNNPFSYWLKFFFPFPFPFPPFSNFPSLPSN